VTYFRNETLKCLTEITNIKEETYNDRIKSLLLYTVKNLVKIIDSGKIFNKFEDIPKIHKNGNSIDQEFIQILGIFLTTTFRNHIEMLEKDSELTEAIKSSHYILIEISKIEEIEVFKNCLEYWIFLCSGIYHSSKNIQNKEENFFNNRSLLLLENNNEDQRNKFYEDILSSLRTVLVSRMAKPEEVRKKIKKR
jgi:exportin-1